jgi:hypothetical protein
LEIVNKKGKEENSEVKTRRRRRKPMMERGK